MTVAPRSSIRKSPVKSWITQRRPVVTLFYNGLPITRFAVPFPDPALLKKMKIRFAGILPKVTNVCSSFVGGLFQKLSALSQTPAPLRMRPESFEVAGHGRIEDCHFIYGTNTIGVADGVGGYRREGIDPGEYAEELMLNSLAAVIHHHHPHPRRRVDPFAILRQAFSQTLKPGGSTACIINLAGRDLRFVNVGDSGFKVFRGDRVAYESPVVGGKKFNAPAKLCAHKGVTPSKGRVRVKAGDLVVAGTDGLFDNLHTWEIQRILESGMKLESESESAGMNSSKELARTIALTAFQNSIDENYSSPFQAQALKAGLRYSGGKPDDITVVVARIEESAPGD